MAELVAVLLSFLKAIGNYRWYAIAISWVIALGGWTYVYSLPDEYQATAKVYVDTQSILKPLMASMTTMPNVEQQVMFMRRTLISRPNVERVMRMVDLDIKAKTPRDQELMVDKLMSQIKMGGTERDDIYTISYAASNPKVGKEVVQSLLQIFVEGSFGGKKLDSEKAIQFIDEQIKMYEERLAAGENSLKEFKIRNMGMLPRGGGDYASGYGDLADKLSQARLELLEAEEARNAIKRQMTGDELAPVGGATAAEPASPELDDRIAGLNKQLDALRLQFTEEHPDIVASLRLLANLKERKKEEAKKVRAADPSASYSPMLQQMNVALSVEEAKIASLKARVNEYTSRLAQMRSNSNMAPEIEAQLSQLNRDYTINKENYEKLVQRRESAKLSGDLSTATDMMSFRVVEPPTAPRTPIGPNRLRLYSIVLAVSLAVGLGAALLLSQIRPTFLSQRSLRDATGYPVLGVISMNWTDAEKIKRRRRLIGFGMALMSLISAYAGILTLTLFRTA
jgi:polysaccharide chain length determinant protein (PEP-CTERM system associated)